jgi:hypothetical protein
MAQWKSSVWNADAAVWRWVLTLARVP